MKLCRIDWIYNVNNSGKLAVKPVFKQRFMSQPCVTRLSFSFLEYFSEIDEECATVLIDFEYLMDFVFQVRCGRIQLDPNISKPLWYEIIF